MPRAQTEDPERCSWHDTLIEALGRNGKNGRLGNLESKVDEACEELKGVKAVQLKLIIYTALAAGGSSAAASLVLKFLA